MRRPAESKAKASARVPASTSRSRGWRARVRRLLPEWLARSFARAWAVLRVVADLFPLTPLGGAACLGAAAALRYFAYAEMDLVFLVLGWAVVGMTSLSLLAVIVASVWLRWTARSPAEVSLTMETARGARSGFSLPAMRFVPLLQLRFELIDAPHLCVTAVETEGKLWEMLHSTRRGQIRALRRRLVISDAFGLARIAFRVGGKAEVEVLPHRGALGRMPLLSSFAGGDERPHPMGIADGDRVELRKYAPGDPARFIHWKVFSRTRKLVVRVPERALTLAIRTVAYLVSGPTDGASAAAARVAVAAGALGEEWVFGADGTAGTTSEVAEATSRIVRSAAPDVVGGSGLARYVASAEREGPATLVLFVPATPGDWLPPTLAVLRARRGRARVVIGVDTIRRADTTALWRRVISRAKPLKGVPEADLTAVRTALAAVGAEVLVLDRVSGRLLGRGAARARGLQPSTRAA